MKVLLVNKFHYRRGGSETYYFALGEALRAMGHEVVHFSMQDERNEPCAQSEYFAAHVGFEAGQGARQKIASALRFVYSPAAGRRLDALIRAEKPDIAHLNLVHRHLTFSIVNALKRRGVPMVMTLHDYIPICPNYTMLSGGEPCERCMAGNPIHCLKRRCVRGSLLMSALSTLEALYLRASRGYDKIDQYIAPSRFMRSMLEKSRFSKSPVLHLCNFLPPGAARARVDAPGGYLLYSGRLSPEKGVRTLLKAYTETENCPELRVAGDGTERAWAESFVRERGLSARVKLLGHQGRAEMDALIAGARAIVVPSEWYENCPYSVMEAMAAGKPVLGARIGGIPELVEDGVTGLLFEPFSAESLRASLEALSDMGEEAYLRMCGAAADVAAERFDSERYARAITALYEALQAGQIQKSEAS